MAASLQFSGVRTIPCAKEFRRNSLSIESNRLKFSSSVASASGFVCARIEGACRSNRVLKISCQKSVEETETTNGSPDGNIGQQLTCVMKFGGSSVASAERMREVADLILSFPEERPVIVLSAMGKTTNKLLQVDTDLLSLIFSVLSIFLLLG